MFAKDLNFTQQNVSRDIPTESFVCNSNFSVKGILSTSGNALLN